VFEIGEDLLDRIEDRTAGRQKNATCAGGAGSHCELRPCGRRARKCPFNGINRPLPTTRRESALHGCSSNPLRGTLKL